MIETRKGEKTGEENIMMEEGRDEREEMREEGNGCDSWKERKIKKKQKEEEEDPGK